MLKYPECTKQCFECESFDICDRAPSVESEDVGCYCDEAIESEWEWNPDELCYKCSTCGCVQ